MPDNGIEATHIQTAGVFLEYLQLRHDRWLDPSEWSSSWVFRGQRNSDWSLLPKMWRLSEPTVEAMLTRLKGRYKLHPGDHPPETDVLEYIIGDTFDRAYNFRQEHKMPHAFYGWEHFLVQFH